jgi:tetratricopeptide (TPR) repeat protein
MRLVDQLGQSPHPGPSAFLYQFRATSNFLDELHPPTVDVNHLRQVVQVAKTAHGCGDSTILWPSLLAYAYWLEQQLFLAEALDVLDTTLQLRAGEELVAAHLQRARVLRLAGRHDEARAAYELAGELAVARGDTHSLLLSRIGGAIVLQKVGNLPESERVLRGVLAEAERVGDRDVEGRACHDLAAALHLAGRTARAVPLAFRAYRLYDLPVQRARALSDTGVLLKALGVYAAARQAFSVVLQGKPPPEIRLRAVVELLEVDALAGDRVSFERWRRELTDRYDDLPPDERVNFEIHVGIGLALFGSYDQAERHVQRAIDVAERHAFGERIFHAEAVLRHVREHRVPPEVNAVPPVADIGAVERDVQNTIECLAALHAT